MATKTANKAPVTTAKNLQRINNADLWNAVRSKYPTFRNHTAEASLEWFNEKTFENMLATEVETLNDFYLLSMRVYLNLIQVSRAVDTLEASGFGEYYDEPYGGITQRISVNSIKPVSPAYRNLQNYQTVDPFVIKKPESSERFYQKNFDYQSLVTIQDEFQLKTMFVNEYGMSEYMAGIFQGLENGYITQLYLNKLEALNAGINSTTNPMQDTQQVTVPMSSIAEPTADELVQFILTVKHVVEAMAIGTQSSAYNAGGFMTYQERGRLKLLLRVGIQSATDVLVMANSYNQERLNLPIDVIVVPNFGGLIPVAPGTTTEVYPVYDPLGTQIGFNTVAGSTEVTITNDEVEYSDPNEDVVAMLADSGYVFHTRQNPYTVEPIRNPRGLYTNYWASSPNNGIHVDHYYNAIVFKAVPSAPEPDPGA